MQGLIRIEDFMAHLKAHGLVIVRGDELVEKKMGGVAYLRKKYMKRRAVTFKEILDAQLLPVRSKQGIQSWIDTGKIKEGEVVPGKVRRILTSAIRRLGYED